MEQLLSDRIHFPHVMTLFLSQSSDLSASFIRSKDSWQKWAAIIPNVLFKAEIICPDMTILTHISQSERMQFEISLQSGKYLKSFKPYFSLRNAVYVILSYTYGITVCQHHVVGEFLFLNVHDLEFAFIARKIWIYIRSFGYSICHCEWRYRL